MGEDKEQEEEEEQKEEEEEREDRESLWMAEFWMQQAWSSINCYDENAGARRSLGNWRACGVSSKVSIFEDIYDRRAFEKLCTRLTR